MAAEASSHSTNPKPFSQGQLNDLVRDLNLSKESSEILASQLGEHGILDLETKITFLHHRDDNFLLRVFAMEDDFVYCNNIPGFLAKMGLPVYNSDEWRLFIDSSKQSLKCVLLHKGNNFACTPIERSVVFKEQYLNVKMVLNKLCTVSITGPYVWTLKWLTFCWKARGVHQVSLFSLLLGGTRRSYSG